MKYNSDFDIRFAEVKKEFEWLYMELYNSRDSLSKLELLLSSYNKNRSNSLKELDKTRQNNINWYRSNKMLGITLYTDLFCSNLKSLITKIPYLKELGIDYLHLMPLLKMPSENNDGGYAVDDFEKINETIGSNEDFEKLTNELRNNNISLCLDFVMNHTSDTHRWAIEAKKGNIEYQNYYYITNDSNFMSEYEKHVPQVFPTTAPGNFTYIECLKKWALTSFYPFQWDLNYQNPKVFFEMIKAFLTLANMGVEIFRLDAVPYIWKQLGTNCRNLKQVHTIVRMLRIVIECVCPAVILKGEVVMAPKELSAYFGTPESPECHILYNVSCMVNLWSSLASKDIRLLNDQLNLIHSLPENSYFINYIRCHDDIGWGLDEEAEIKFGIDPQLHKEFLYHFYIGQFENSYAKGLLYNFDYLSKDARSCGTTASLCGLETAKNIAARNIAINRILLMHSCMFSFYGFPMLNSGDEVGQLNDWSYFEKTNLKNDSRNLHRSKFDWVKAKNRYKISSSENSIWCGLQKLIFLRKSIECFDINSSISTWDTGNNHVLSIVRKKNTSLLICIFNFSDEIQTIQIKCLDDKYVDLISGQIYDLSSSFYINPYQYLWLTKQKSNK